MLSKFDEFFLKLSKAGIAHFRQSATTDLSSEPTTSGRLYFGSTYLLDRTIPGVVFPSSVEEVKQLIAVANELKINLYPISTGLNWGYGSRFPVQNESIIVDLSKKMRSILSFCEKKMLINIEPGVTQKMVSDFLKEKNSFLFLDMTASSPDSSVLGNALDFGMGTHHLRLNCIYSLRGVLGNGQEFDSRERFYQSKTQSPHLHDFPSGSGPELLRLFAQSDFCMVTSATFKLNYRSERSGSFVLFIKNKNNLIPCIQSISLLKKKQIISSLPRFFETSKLRENTLNAFKIWPLNKLDTEWRGIGHIGGEKRVYKAIRQEIKKELSRYGLLIFLDRDYKERILHAIKKIFASERYAHLVKSTESLFRAGQPSNFAVNSIFNGKDPHESEIGFISGVFLSDTHSFDPTLMKNKIMSYSDEIDISYSIVFLDEIHIALVLSIFFEKDKKSEKALCAFQAIKLFLQKNEMPILKIPISFQTDWMPQNRRAIHEQLKKALDPNHIISSKNYTDT
jgi:hypothetical protein